MTMKPTYLYFNYLGGFKVHDTLQINHTVYAIVEVVRPTILRTMVKWLGAKLPRVGAVRVEYLHTTIISDQLN